MSKESSPSHIPSLDGIRAIAFLTVYVAHGGLGNIVPGGFGVTIFFFLSGYLITTLLRQETLKYGMVSLRSFYIRRAFRILPPMYITLAVTYLLVWAKLASGPAGFLGFLSALLYVNNYYSLLAHSPTLPIGATILWSLAIEEHFYLIFPFVYRAFLRNRITQEGQSRMLLAGCAGALLWRTFLVFSVHTQTAVSMPWTYIATDCRFDAIAWGCLLAIRNSPTMKDHSPLFERNAGKLALAGLALIVASLVYRNTLYRETLRYTVQEIALYPIFYYCVAYSQSWQVRWLEWKWIRWVGWLSYSLYLIHFVILDCLERAFPKRSVTVFFAGLILALFYAWIMRETVEVPLRRMRERVERKFRREISLRVASSAT